MDTYCEQIVKTKKGAKYYFGVVGIWLAAVILAYLGLVFLGIIAPILIVTVGYGAYYLCGFLSVEYEYIITNGTMDIDVIYAKRSRKRLSSFELSTVESIEKYKGEAIDKNRFKKSVVSYGAGNDAYKMIMSSDSGLILAVISPDERTRQEIVKWVPKFVGNTAFR